MEYITWEWYGDLVYEGNWPSRSCDWLVAWLGVLGVPNMYEYEWVWMSMYEYVKVCMSMHKYVWVYMSMYEHV